MTNSESTPSRHVAVVGGGITGLAAAHRLVELDPTCKVTLLEKTDRLGGVVQTIHEDGFQIEQSADNFITTVPWGLDLCKRLGLEDRLVQTNPEYRRTFVIRKNKLYRLPDGFLMMAPTQMWPLAVTPILSPLGKLRAGLEYFIPPRKGDDDESMASFVRRRLGKEVFERLVEPLVSAVYAADMEKLSLLATLPRFRDLEIEHGSLIKAMRKQMKAGRKGPSESGARYSMFVTLEDGLCSLIDALAAKLPEGSIRLNTSVTQLECENDGWRLTLSDDSAESFDAVILATPSHAAAKLLKPVSSDVSEELGGIPHEGTAIVTVAFDREQVRHPLDGMGFVVPTIEGSPILAGSFSSHKYTHRAPEGKVLLRIFAGGARAPEMADMDDAKLVPLILKELDGLIGIKGKPIYTTTAHWPNTMPQYHVGHKDLVARVRAGMADLSGLEIAGNAFDGVGLPNCIHGGEEAAERIIS